MRCQMTKLILLFGTLSLSSCAKPPAPIDSFCQLYERVIQEKGDGVITAKPAVKRRILTNEQLYRECSRADGT